MKSVQLRGWQQEAFALYQEELQQGKKVALWEATPGAGKTTAALTVATHQLKARLAQHVLVVVPTTHLRNQWSRAAAQFGLHLDSTFGGIRTRLSSDYHGAVVTYQQFSTRQKVFAELAKQSVVILDEVHHAGDGLTWGVLLRATLQDSRFILCLSGTAFRSDNNSIPFIRYDSDGTSTPDYSYSYSKAVEEGVCRPTAFFTYGGEVSWSENEQVLAASFSDALDGPASARRLRAALDPETGWIQPMLRDAHEMLQNIRREHPHAGGLIACADQQHARNMAKLLTAITGEKPTVVLSDDKTASKKIKQFSESSHRWLIACNMVSEGVDIPRLRVGVYATTIRTKMYFRQFLGRVVRRETHLKGHQVAYLYLPADSLLHHFAEEIESETRHFLNKKKDSFWGDEQEERSKKESPEKTQTWTPLSAINSGIDAVIVHGNQLSLFGESFAPESVQQVVEREVALRLEEKLTKSELKLKLGSDIKRLVGMYHKKSGKPHSVIHTILNKAQGVRSQTYCTERQLEDRINLLKQMLASDTLPRRAVG